MGQLSEFESVIKKLYLFQHSPSQLYEPLSGTNEYGPYGATIKNNIAQTLRKLLKREDFWEVDFPIISPEKIWSASGHLDKFKNYTATSNGKTYHLEKFLPENMNVSNETEESLSKFLKENKIIPKGNSEPLQDVKSHPLLVSAKIGTQPIILRPETATTSYLSFKAYHSLFKEKMPIKVFQYGNAFRNEMTGRRGLIRSREFEQFEAQIFLLEENKNEEITTNLEQEIEFIQQDNQSIKQTANEAMLNQTINYEQFAYSVNMAVNIMTELGIPLESIRLKKPDERFRSETDIEKERKPETWNLEVKTEKYGWLDIGEVHERFDLNYHQEHTNKKLSIKNKNKEDEIPIILEIAFGMGRLMYSVLEKSFYQRDGKNIFGLKNSVAPIQLAVLPLTKDDNIQQTAKEILQKLKKQDYTTVLETSGSIGKRYARMDELGVPYCITTDYETAEDQSVTIRNRDTTKQERFAIDNIETAVYKLLK